MNAESCFTLNNGIIVIAAEGEQKETLRRLIMNELNASASLWTANEWSENGGRRSATFYNFPRLMAMLRLIQNGETRQLEINKGMQ